jgi:hypothetical protein
MSLPSFLRYVHWRGQRRALACLLAFLLVPLVVGAVNMGSKVAGAAADRPAYKCGQERCPGSPARRTTGKYPTDRR